MVLSSKSLVILKIRESFVVQHKIVKIRKDYFFLKFSIFIFFNQEYSEIMKVSTVNWT